MEKSELVRFNTSYTIDERHTKTRGTIYQDREQNGIPQTPRWNYLPSPECPWYALMAPNARLPTTNSVYTTQAAFQSNKPFPMLLFLFSHTVPSLHY